MLYNLQYPIFVSKPNAKINKKLSLKPVQIAKFKQSSSKPILAAIPHILPFPLCLSEPECSSPFLAEQRT
jgi:hypothetical protein